MHITSAYAVRLVAIGVALLAVAHPSASQSDAGTPDTLAAPQTVLDGFHTKSATLQDLSLPQNGGQAFEVGVVFHGAACVLELREHDVRSTNFQLLVQDATGLKSVPRPANVTYRGVVRGHGDSAVAATLHQGQLKALVRLASDQPFLSIQPLDEVLKGAKRETHAVFCGADSTAPRGTCRSHNHGAPVAALNTGGTTARSGTTIYECDLACDADLTMYRDNGSNVTATQNDILDIVNGCNVIYERDCQIRYVVGTIIVRTTAVYNATPIDPFTTLQQFRSRWLNFHGNIVRDVAHLFVGGPRFGDIGIAYLRSICDRNIGYGLSFSHYSPNRTDRVALTAHELGHGWGADHCTGSNCFIMCAVTGNCGRPETKFAPSVINQIVSFRATRTCLKAIVPNVPVINTVSPNSVQGFRGGTIDLFGSKFTGALHVKVAGSPTPFVIKSDSWIEFEAPTALVLGRAVDVTVENNSGPSAPKQLTFTPTIPPLLEANKDAVRGNEMLWEFGGGVPNQWGLFVSATPATFTFLGHNFLRDSPIMLVRGVLSAGGYGTFKIPVVPTSAMVGLKFYSQVWTAKTFWPNAFDGNSNVTETTIK